MGPALLVLLARPLFWTYWGNPPPSNLMNKYKITSSRPAQAVGYQAQGLGADGDGGATAGGSLVGVGAASAEGNHTCETPSPVASQQSASGPNSDLLPSRTGRAQYLGPSEMPGTSSRGPRSEAMASPIRLKDHTFRIGTWNMRGKEGTFDGRPTLKSSLAEELLLLERIDILVLTETHCVDFSVSRKATLLGHTGISPTHAGVAVISSSKSGWYCTDSHILVDGYALLLHLHHHCSAESLWILGVYGDTSNAGRSLCSFYSKLADALATVVLDTPDWRGCFTAGDWNFVLHPEDRIPTPINYRVPFRSDFDYLLNVCSMSDAAGPDPFPKGWSYRYSINNSHCYSHLDRVYCPSTSWSASTPTSVPTLWSDHCIVWADCTAISPKVQMAIPASHLPDPAKLDDFFWSDVLKAYSALTDAPVSLPSWSSFKKQVLSLGSQSKARRKHRNTKHWEAALRGDQLSRDNLTSALRDMYSDQPTVSSSPQCRWPPAAPSYASRPPLSYPSFIPTPESPWANTTVVPWKHRRSRSSPPSGLTPIPRPSTVESAAQIHRALTSRIKSRRAAALKKLHLMTTKHTSEWYNLSSNKEADE